MSALDDEERWALNYSIERKKFHLDRLESENRALRSALADLISEVERVIPPGNARSQHWSGLISRAKAALADEQDDDA